MKQSALACAVLLALSASSCSSIAASTPAHVSYAPASSTRNDLGLSLANELRPEEPLALDDPPPPTPDQDTTAGANYPNMYRRMGLSLGAAFYSNFDSSAQVDTSTSVGA